MKLAIWLLGRFGVPEHNASLMGDLAEERANGRSAWWFWGQTFAAIGDTVVHDLLDHWLLAFRAIATGWVVSFLILRILGRVPLFFAPFHLFELSYLLVPVAVGWMVARTHRAHQAAMVLAFAASVVVCAPWIDYFDPTFLPLAVLGALIGGLLVRPKRISLRTQNL